MKRALQEAEVTWFTCNGLLPIFRSINASCRAFWDILSTETEEFLQVIMKSVSNSWRSMICTDEFPESTIYDAIHQAFGLTSVFFKGRQPYTGH